MTEEISSDYNCNCEPNATAMGDGETGENDFAVQSEICFFQRKLAMRCAPE